MIRSIIIMAWRDSMGRARAQHARLIQGRDLIEVAGGSDHVVMGNPARIRTSGQDLLVLGSLHGTVPVRRQGGALDRLRSLVAGNWGSYLAFGTDDDGTQYVMVDPSGAGRAHLIEDRHLAMVTDRLDPALAKAAGFAIGVDVAALAGCLLDPGTMVTAPLLEGVTPMVPGTAYALGVGKQPVTLWDPARITRDGADEGDGSPLRLAVDAAVGRMCGKASLIELSGGLDSSIVAGTVADLRLTAKGVGVEMIGGDVDERRYAEVTAAKCGLPLHHGRTSAYPNYAAFMDIEQAAHPYMYGLDDAFARVVTDALTDETDQIVTGQGGDAVFFQPATPLTTVDRVRALGMRSGWGELLDDAWRTRASIWHHIIPAALDYLRPVTLPRDELAGGLLTPEAREDRSRFVHPWCTNARLPPGRALQLLMLANSQVFHSARAIDLGRPLVHPLLSQPVLERALAIPTWHLASGPYDRGLARRIFADRLHPDVAKRRSKGEAAAFYSRAAAANLPYLRERLLGGALVKAGIADQAALERALTAEYLFHSLDYRAIVLHAACEAWLSAWKR